jgi:Nucleotidyl transferase of unknown function (DUF2204)
MPRRTVGYHNATMMSDDLLALVEQLRTALRGAASSLKSDGLRFALAGSYALWAYGGPEPSNDVDFVVLETDTEKAAGTLERAGFEIERTPEDWLFKAHLGAATTDVLHRVNGTPVDADLLDKAEELAVLAITMPVLPPTTVMIQKLRALNEHYCDFAHLLPPVRAVREHLDWEVITAEVSDSPYAAAFLVLAQRLGLRDGR